MVILGYLNLNLSLGFLDHIFSQSACST